MTNTAKNDDAMSFDEDDTLTEVGEDHDFELDDDEADPGDRRLDPLRQPH